MQTVLKKYLSLSTLGLFFDGKSGKAVFKISGNVWGGSICRTYMRLDSDSMGQRTPGTVIDPGCRGCCRQNTWTIAARTARPYPNRTESIRPEADRGWEREARDFASPLSFRMRMGMRMRIESVHIFLFLILIIYGASTVDQSIKRFLKGKVP